MTNDKKAVLVVDDEPACLRSTCRILQRAGYRVVQASNAAGARAALASGDVGVVVLDVVLPDLNGIELLRQLDHEHADVAVVIVTGSPARFDRSEAIRCGAISYLRKPLDAFLLEGQVAIAEHALKARHEQDARYAELEGSVCGLRAALERVPRQLAEQLTSAWDLRHVETGTHVRRIGAHSEALATALGFTHEDATTLGQVAMLHDVGKITIPDAILTKPGKLTAEEFEIMKLHSAAGARLLGGGDHPFLEQAAQVALRHHERWNGSGYPDGLRGEECPYEARIVAVADVFDALGQVRCYKPAWTEAEIEVYFHRNSGVLFEPKIVDALLSTRSKLREIALRLPDPTVAPMPLESATMLRAEAVALPPLALGQRLCVAASVDRLT